MEQNNPAMFQSPPTSVSLPIFEHYKYIYRMYAVRSPPFTACILGANGFLLPWQAGKSPNSTDVSQENKSSIWLVVSSPLKNMKVNGKDYPI